MSVTAEKIVAEALELSSDARAFVAERLIESLDTSSPSSLSPAWREEIRRRCREVDQGMIQLRDEADVFAKAYAALR